MSKVVKAKRKVPTGGKPHPLIAPTRVTLEFPAWKGHEPCRVVIERPETIKGVYWGKTDANDSVPSPTLWTAEEGANVDKDSISKDPPRQRERSARDMDELMPPACYWDGMQWICC